MGYTKVMLQKKEFVHKELLALLRKIDPTITGVEYLYDDNGEVVKVFYDKAVLRVDVTADSLATLTQDVLGKVA